MYVYPYNFVVSYPQDQGVLPVKQKQLGVSLSEETRARLDAAAEAAGHSTAEEARQRIERTLSQDGLAPALKELVEDAIALAGLVEVDTGDNWTTDPASHATFKAALLALLDRHRPEGPAIFGAVRSLFGDAPLDAPDSPETVGRALVRYHKRHQATKGAAGNAATAAGIRKLKKG
jgi:hypothetical protein